MKLTFKAYGAARRYVSPNVACCYFFNYFFLVMHVSVWVQECGVSWVSLTPHRGANERTKETSVVLQEWNWQGQSDVRVELVASGHLISSPWVVFISLNAVVSEASHVFFANMI